MPFGKHKKKFSLFWEEKERAVLQGNLNVLNDIISSYKHNWENETFKSNKHILVQQIKKESEASIILYRDQIAQRLKKRSFIHSDQDVSAALKKLQEYSSRTINWLCISMPILLSWK